MRGQLDDLERDDKFVWTAEHQKVLEILKKVRQSDLLLKCTEKAIAHASRSLTKAENYGQIEKN